MHQNAHRLMVLITGHLRHVYTHVQVGLKGIRLLKRMKQHSECTIINQNNHMSLDHIAGYIDMNTCFVICSITIIMSLSVQYKILICVYYRVFKTLNIHQISMYIYNGSSRYITCTSPLWKLQMQPKIKAPERSYDILRSIR